MLRLSGDDEGDSSVQDGNVAIGILFAAKHTLKRRRIGGWITSSEFCK